MSLTKQQHSLGPTDIAPSSYGCSELGSTLLVAQVPPPPIHGNGRCEPTPSWAKRAQAVASVSLIHGEVDRGRDSHGRPREGRPIDVSRPAFPWVETALILDREWPQGTPGIRITTINSYDRCQFAVVNDLHVDLALTLFKFHGAMGVAHM